MKRNKLNRRTFIKKTSATAIAASLPTIVPASVFGKNAPSNRIQVGQIGCGRIARDHDMPGTMQYDTAATRCRLRCRSKSIEGRKKNLWISTTKTKGKSRHENV